MDTRKRNRIFCIVAVMLSVFWFQNAFGYQINLNKDLNLISLPEQPANTAIDQVTSSIKGKFNSIWAYVGGSWKLYDPGDPNFSDLLTMEAGQGYWIDMKESGALWGSGTAAPSSIPLSTGWNLIGYNSTISASVTDALKSISGKYDAVWAYRDGVWKLYDPQAPNFSDLTLMEPGAGYWVQAIQSCTIDFSGLIGTTISPDTGGTVTTGDGASVEFPADFSDSDISAIFTKSSDTTDAPEDENIKSVSGEYTLMVSSSASFRRDIAISLPVDASLLPALPKGFDESDRRLFINLEFYNNQTAKWERYGSLLFYDAKAGLVTVPLVMSDFTALQTSLSGRAHAGIFSREVLPSGIEISSGVKYRITALTDYGMKIVQKDGSPFYFVYYTCAAQLKDSVAWCGEPVPGASSDPDVDDYIEFLDKVLQEAYSKLAGGALDKNGTKVFSALSTPQKVIVKDLGESAEGGSKIGGPLVIDNDRPMSDLGGIAAHELTHVFQGQYYKGWDWGIITDRIARWFIEGTADHYAEFVFPKPIDAPDSHFLSVPLDASDEVSYYSVKFFLKWLATNYGENIVGDTLRWRKSPNGSVYDTINLSNAIGENGSFTSDNLETAFEKYCIYVMQNPDIPPNSSIKDNMENFLTMNAGVKTYTYLTDPDTTFTAQNTYFGFLKIIKNLSAAYFRIVSRHPDNVKLVIVPGNNLEGNKAVKSMTYVGKGSTKSDYESKKTVESENNINPSYLSNKSMSAKDIKKGTIEHMLYNPTQDKSLFVALQYYILAPPKVTQVGSGTNGGIILWSTQGIDTPGGIPGLLIKGYDVYDKSGKKLNNVMIGLPATAGSDQSFESPAIDSTKTGNDYTVVIVDRYGNSWPEVAQTPEVVTVTISPENVTLNTGGTQTFTATVTGTTNTAVTWSVQEGDAGGTITTTGGVYTAPNTAGTYHVVATSQDDPTKFATATVTVTVGVGKGPVIKAIMLANKNMPGNWVKIIGEGFGNNRGSSYVTFNGIPEDSYYYNKSYSYWLDHEIGIMIPSCATTGDVKVWVNGLWSNGFPFVVEDDGFFGVLKRTKWVSTTFAGKHKFNMSDGGQSNTSVIRYDIYASNRLDLNHIDLCPPLNWGESSFTGKCDYYTPNYPGERRYNYEISATLSCPRKIEKATVKLYSDEEKCPGNVWTNGLCPEGTFHEISDIELEVRDLPFYSYDLNKVDFVYDMQGIEAQPYVTIKRAEYWRKSKEGNKSEVYDSTDWGSGETVPDFWFRFLENY
jgi:hypothetical protein